MKKLYSTIIAIMLIMGLLTQNLNAETAKTESETGVEITFSENINIVDPDNPEEPGIDVNPDSNMALQIWKVPTSLKFEEAVRSNQAQSYAIEEMVGEHYGVFDYHKAMPEWTLSAQLSNLKDSDDKNLEGVQLVWTNGTLNYIDSVGKEDNNRQTSRVTRPDTVTLDAGQGQVNVLSALGEIDQKGHFEVKLENISLEIPKLQGDTSKTYNGNIKWVLNSDVHSQE